MYDKLRIGFLPNKNDCTKAHARIKEEVFHDKKKRSGERKGRKKRKEKKGGDTRILLIIADCLCKALSK